MHRKEKEVLSSTAFATQVFKHPLPIKRKREELEREESPSDVEQEKTLKEAGRKLQKYEDKYVEEAMSNSLPEKYYANVSIKDYYPKAVRASTDALPNESFKSEDLIARAQAEYKQAQLNQIFQYAPSLFSTNFEEGEKSFEKEADDPRVASEDDETQTPTQGYLRR